MRTDPLLFKPMGRFRSVLIRRAMSIGRTAIA